MDNNILAFLASAIEFGVIFLFGCVGEIVTEKSGHLNLGIPGIKCMGAAGGCLGVKLCYLTSPAPGAFLVVLLAILFAMLFAGALGAVYGFLTVSLRSNQNVTGLACTIFGVGFTSFFLNNAVLTEGVVAQLSQAGNNFFDAPLPGAETTGWFGTLFLDHGILVYLAIVIAVIAAVVLRYTKASLSLRAVGENPAADPPAQHRALRRHHPGAHSHQHHRLPRDAAPRKSGPLLLPRRQMTIPNKYKTGVRTDACFLCRKNKRSPKAPPHIGKEQILGERVLFFAACGIKRQCRTF